MKRTNSSNKQKQTNKNQSSTTPSIWNRSFEQSHNFKENWIFNLKNLPPNLQAQTDSMENATKCLKNEHQFYKTSPKANEGILSNSFFWRQYYLDNKVLANSASRWAPIDLGSAPPQCPWGLRLQAGSSRSRLPPHLSARPAPIPRLSTCPRTGLIDPDSRLAPMDWGSQPAPASIRT